MRNLKYKILRFVILAMLLILTAATPVVATPTVFFSTGVPDGRIATGSRPASAGKIEIESADDFVLVTPMNITSATFTGLLTGGADTFNIVQVLVEIYRVFPNDSTVPPSGNVPTRSNSPSDVAFDTRDSPSGLSFNTTKLAPFTAANSVLNGIHKIPAQTTGGEGPVTGTEVLFDVTFTPPFSLPAGHYFFVPQVEVNLPVGEFLWLSAAKPIVLDLQTWIRNADLAPDWLRIGTDIVGGNPAPTFNGAFSLSGEPTSPPTISKAFGVANIPLNGTTSLTLIITNPAANTVGLTGVAFSDNLPAGLVVATPNGLTNTCGGTATAVAGSGSVSLTGGTVVTSSDCTVSVDVTGRGLGNLINTTGEVSSTNAGPGNTATASVNVLDLPTTPVPTLTEWGMIILTLLRCRVGLLS